MNCSECTKEIDAAVEEFQARHNLHPPVCFTCAVERFLRKHSPGYVEALEELSQARQVPTDLLYPHSSKDTTEDDPRAPV